MDKINTLVFEGGAVLGLAYLGVIQELEPRIDFKNIKYLCGSSIGSMIAFVLGLNITADQFDPIVNKIRLHMIMRIPGIGLKLPWNIVFNYGLISNEIVREIVVIILHAVYPNRDDITFKELDKDVIITATNLTDSYFWVASKQTTPNMSVIDAVMYSCCGNLVLTPSPLKLRKQNKTAFIIDGGASVLNYPIGIFSENNVPSYIANMLDNDYSRDLYAQYGGSWKELEKIINNTHNNELLGFNFQSFNPYIDIPIKNTITYLWNFFNITYQSLLQATDRNRYKTINIKVGSVSPVDLSYFLIPSRSKRLINIGREAVINSEFFK